MPAAPPLQGSLLSCFLTNETSGISVSVPENQVAIAAIGTMADYALSSIDSLAQAKHINCRGTTHRDLDELLADPRWQLAQILSPFKASATEACNRLSHQAARLGVVDTLVRAGGLLHGLNANSYAIAAASTYMPHGVTLVVGTGATAASALAGLSTDGDRTLFVVGRSYSKAQAVASSVHAGSPLRDLRDCHPDLIVHATTVGEQNDADSLTPALDQQLRPGVGFLDLNSRVSVLQRSALHSGCIVAGGAVPQALTNGMRLSLLIGDNLFAPDGEK